MKMVLMFIVIEVSLLIALRVLFNNYLYEKWKERKERRRS